MESQKYAKSMYTSPGIDPAIYEIGSGAASLPAASRGLVGYWPLYEGSGSSTADWSGNGNTASLGSNPWIVGHIGEGVAINSGSLSIPYTGAYPVTAITVTAWMNLSANYNWPNYLVNQWGSAPGSWLLYSNVGGNATFGITGPASSTQNNASGCSITTSTWHFIVGTYDGNTVSSYLDGGLCGTHTLTGQILLQPTTLTSATNASGTFNVDDIRLYNRALSAAEIQEVYNAEK
jgi:hypothetical protein